MSCRVIRLQPYNCLVRLCCMCKLVIRLEHLGQVHVSLGACIGMGKPVHIANRVCAINTACRLALLKAGGAGTVDNLCVFGQGGATLAPVLVASDCQLLPLPLLPVQAQLLPGISQSHSTL